MVHQTQNYNLWSAKGATRMLSSHNVQLLMCSPQQAAQSEVYTEDTLND